MKKIIIIISTLGIMSFTTNQIYYSTQLVWAMDNLESMKTWVNEDINNGRMSEEIGELYLDNIDETYSFVNDFYNKQCK
jgi:hypothetical protein